MYLLSQLKLKKFLILLLSLVMCISLAFATACGDTSDDGDSGDSETETQTEQTLTDNQTLKNGDFEYATKKDTKFPYSSSINWTRSVDSDNTSATSSTITSGIIDTEETAYNKLKETERPKDGDEFINPRTPYYYGLTENKFDKDDKEDKVNPNTSGTKILMIANKTAEEGVGTAQKFKASSNIVIPVEGYARVSIWVKTVNLKSASLPEGEFGAYVRFTNKAGSKAFKDLCFENINTYGNWVKYELYIVGTDLSTTTLTMTVGLGDGNSTFTKNFVEGFAYFDNAQVETFTKSKFNALEKPEAEVINDSEKENVYDLSTLVYEANPTEKSEYNAELAAKATCKKSITYRYQIGEESVVEGTNPTHPDYIETAGYDLTGAGQNVMKAGYKNDIDVTAISEELANVESEIDNANPYIAYMNFAKSSVGSYLTNKITLAPGTYNYFTFYAKVNPENSSTKAKVELYDIAADKYVTAFSEMDTIGVEGNYGGWNFYKMMISNPTDTAVEYQIKFTFGENNLKIIEDQWLLQKGYAILADLKVTELDKETGKEIYSLITTGNNFKTSLYGKYNSYVEKDDSESSSNDSYPLYTDVQGSFDIIYKPVTSVYGYSFMGAEEGKCTTGIINSKYINEDGTYGLNNVAIDGLDTFKTLVNSGNTYAQAVVLDNKEAINTSYRSSKITVTANTGKKITLKVKVTDGAVANIYLIDVNGTPLKLDPINVTLKSTITPDTISTVDKWTEVTFYVNAGNEDLSLRVEIWNGDKDLATGSKGAIFFENVKSIDLEEGTFATDKEAYKYDYSSINGYKFETKQHTRPNATLKETVDGEVVESTKTFKPQEIYAGNSIVKFADFTTIYCDDVIDNTSSTEDDGHDHEEEEDDSYQVSTDAALQISSIVIAVVLLAVMLVILVRTTIKKNVKKQVKVKSYYDRNSREKVMEKIASKKKEVKLADDEEEYDYEQAQAVEEEITENANEQVIEETVEEEIIAVEEATEEVVEETVEETVETTEEKTEE